MKKNNSFSILKSPLFIAEIGLNHNGNFGLCYELIKQAKYAGANIAKFQLGWRGNEDEINYIDRDRLIKLKKWCEYFDIKIMFSIFTQESFELINSVGIDRFKIASRTIKDNFSLVKNIVDQGKPTFISLGMWDKEVLPFNNNSNICYFWCKSIYPSTPWDILDFPKDFSNSPYIGYSDHTIGIDTCLLAIARGAKVIEKHFTLDKSDVTIRDHALSATPSEFRLLTQLGTEIYKKIQIGI